MPETINMRQPLMVTGLTILLLFAGLFSCAAAPAFDAVVRSVVRISAFDKSGAGIFATGFLVQAGNSRHNDQAWLVTARHLLDNTAGDSITAGMRRNARGVFSPLPLQIKIRDRGQRLFASHPEFDLAVLKISLPADLDYCMLSRDFVADDRRLDRSGFGPGSQILVPGYPYGEACNTAGFSLTRSGVVSSFPVTPASLYPVFYVDFEVFAGYSGAPIVFVDATGTMFLAGMALEEVFLEELRPQKNKKILRTQRGLGLAKALSATIIKEFINSQR